MHKPGLDPGLCILGEDSLELRLLRSAAREIGTKGFDTRRLRGINRKDNIVTGRNAIVR